jgi:hypothetical protein
MPRQRPTLGSQGVRFLKSEVSLYYLSGSWTKAGLLVPFYQKRARPGPGPHSPGYWPASVWTGGGVVLG